jgi:flagellar motility protein MotE (MotC chaperone)
VTPRLLPIVICSVAALLALKGIGLVTDGGYILGGAGVARAQTAEPPPLNSSPTLELPAAPMVSDSAPTIADAAPTVDLGPAAAPDDAVAGTAVSQNPAEIAAPISLNGAGKEIPLAPQGMTGGADIAIADRLAERRAELDALSAELDLRLALVEAAEKRLEERAASLAGVEARIAALVEEKQDMEDAQFAAVVAMYETMKPRDAAGILNTLEMDVMVRIARAMSARKMSPILAAMNPTRAQQLTARLAAPEIVTAEAPPATGFDALPQIVGQ